MRLIVGLGNPGSKYAGTRHNVGFEVVDLLGARWAIGLKAEKFSAWFGSGEIRGERVALLKPTTFMNRSGRATAAAGRFYKLMLTDLLVVVDDLALPLGRLRLRESGSAGGHNGLQDIIDRVGGDAWCRLRVGIGEAVGSTTTHVLHRFAGAEQETIRRATERAADAVECWIAEGPGPTMTRFNGDLPVVE